MVFLPQSPPGGDSPTGGQDRLIVLVSAHRGARDIDGPKGWENHKAWQGKVYRWRGRAPAQKSGTDQPEGEEAPSGTESTLTGLADGGIIDKKTQPEEKPDVHTVGHIDREIYRCVTEDIRTDEVIITDERISHIKERHPGAYEEFSAYLKEIVEEPDFILPGNRRNTAIILKEIAGTGEVTKTILWLAATGDKPGYKNSIFTLVRIDRDDWDRLLRNKKILYRRK